jgi:hypothetical protein
MSGRHARPVPRDLPATTADDARATVDALDAKAEAEAEIDGAAESGKAEAADRSQETPAPEPPD